VISVGNEQEDQLHNIYDQLVELNLRVERLTLGLAEILKEMRGK
jgi:hypothetical protein